jgi:hypothetical protein
MAHCDTGRSVTVSMRYGGNADQAGATMVSFRGTVDEVGADMTLFFGLTEEQANQAVGAMVAELAQGERAIGALAENFAATPVRNETGTKPATTKARRPVETANAPVLDGVHPLYQAIKDEKTVPKLRELWAKHQGEFDSNPDLMSALTARVREIENAAPARV